MKKLIYLLIVIGFICIQRCAKKDFEVSIREMAIEEPITKKTYQAYINDYIIFDTLPHYATSVIIKKIVLHGVPDDKGEPTAAILIENSYYKELKVGDTLNIGGRRIVDTNAGYCCSYDMYITKHALSEISTGTISGVTISGASVEGSLENIGSRKVTAHGHLWHTNDTALTLTGSGISKNDIGVKTTTGSFITNINGLNENTTYYVRSFATSSIGTSYGEIKNFKTKSE